MQQSAACTTPLVVDVSTALTVANADSGTLSDTLSDCTIQRYTLNLTAGKLYEFKVAGKESSGKTLPDSTLTLLDGDMRVLESVDNVTTFSTEVKTLFDPQMNYVAPKSGTYYLEIATRAHQGGTFSLSQNVYPVSFLLPGLLDMTVSPPANVAPGTPGSYTYAFVTDASLVTEYGFGGFATLDASQQQAVRDIFAFYGAIANLTFTETSDEANAKIRFSMADLPHDTVGRGIQQDHLNPDGSVKNHDIMLDKALFSGSTGGSQSVEDWIHEIGHALGLKHPGNYDGSSGIGKPPFLPAGLDNTKFSVMSYIRDPDNPWGGTSHSTPTLIDIATIQYIYGANLSQAGQPFTYSPPNATPFVGSVASQGADLTIDAHNQTVDAAINLTPGTFSSIGIRSDGSSAHDNICLPFGTIAVAAIGGHGNDVINGNDLDNQLTGGPGDDLIDGGGGSNTAHYAGARANYDVKKTSASFIVTDTTGAEGKDTLRNIQFIQFADTSSPLAIDSAVTP